MSNRTRLVSWLLAVLPVLAQGQALDPSTVTLNAAGAEKFIRATQAIAASGQGPSMQGGGPGMNVAKVMRPLVLAWELPPGAAAQWSGICADAQRRLSKK